MIELAPAEGLKEETRAAILKNAVDLLSSAKYRNAGTVEFLVDMHGKHYFLEVNPRVQVEHTVTEEITGIDIVQSQILIASGKSLPDLGLTQDKIPEPMGCAMQCRVTTEDPSQDFRPDTGTISVFRMPAGMGIRLDDVGCGFVNMLSSHYKHRDLDSQERTLLHTTIRFLSKSPQRHELVKKLQLNLYGLLSNFESVVSRQTSPFY